MGKIAQALLQGPRLLFCAALIIQITVSLTAVGVYHPDQHFQIIEFSSRLLKTPSAASQVWELGAQIRPTLQVWLFSGYYLVCRSLGLQDPWQQLILLRLLLSLGLLVLFNAMAWYYFRSATRPVRNTVLLLLNFSWILPYTRTLFSSEILSSALFFGALFLYDVRRNRSSLFLSVLTGFLLSCAFYARFQIGFAIAGFLLWMLLYDRKQLLPLLAGAIPGILLNTVLDHQFYHNWVFTPWNYYFQNITEGKAAAMGTASFLLYIGVLLAVLPAPPLSIVLLWSAIKAAWPHRASLYILPIVFFILGHCLVSHKEERFLFPILNFLPILIGWGLPALFRYDQNGPRWGRYLLRICITISVLLNTVLLSILLFTPYSQAIHFTRLLHRRFPAEPVTIVCLKQSPWETEHGLTWLFYQRSATNVRIRKAGTLDSLATGQETWFSAPYNQTSKEEKARLEKLGYRPVLYSSRLLWEIDCYLGSQGVNTINDIWVLYKKGP